LQKKEEGREGGREGLTVGVLVVHVELLRVKGQAQLAEGRACILRKGEGGREGGRETR